MASWKKKINENPLRMSHPYFERKLCLPALPGTRAPESHCLLHWPGLVVRSARRSLERGRRGFAELPRVGGTTDSPALRTLPSIFFVLRRGSGESRTTPSQGSCTVWGVTSSGETVEVGIFFFLPVVAFIRSSIIIPWEEAEANAKNGAFSKPEWLLPFPVVT